MGPKVQQQNAQSWIAQLHKQFLDVHQWSWKSTKQGLCLEEKHSAHKPQSIQVPKREILVQLCVWFTRHQLTLCQSWRGSRRDQPPACGGGPAAEGKGAVFKAMWYQTQGAGGEWNNKRRGIMLAWSDTLSRAAPELIPHLQIDWHLSRRWVCYSVTTAFSIMFDKGKKIGSWSEI